MTSDAESEGFDCVEISYYVSGACRGRSLEACQYLQSEIKVCASEFIFQPAKLPEREHRD